MVEKIYSSQAELAENKSWDTELQVAWQKETTIISLKDTGAPLAVCTLRPQACMSNAVMAHNKAKSFLFSKALGFI